MQFPLGQLMLMLGEYIPTIHRLAANMVVEVTLRASW